MSRLRVRDADAAEPDVVAVLEGVDVDSRCRCARRRGLRRARPRRATKSSAVVIFMLPFSPSNTETAQARPFGERRIVGEILAPRGGGAAMRVEQRAEARRPAASARCAGRERSSVAVTISCASTSLTVSVTGRAGDRGAMPAAAAIARLDQRVGHERPRRVMDQHDLRRGRAPAPRAQRAPNPAAWRRRERALRGSAPRWRPRNAPIVGVDDGLDDVDLRVRGESPRGCARRIGAPAERAVLLRIRRRRACRARPPR